MGKASSTLVLGLDDKVSGPAKGIEGVLLRLGQRQGTFADGMMRTTGATSKAASALGLYARGAMAVAGPLAGAEGMRQTVVAAADFESAMTGIQKKAGTTTAQTAKLAEEIKELATNGSLAVPIEEIAAAYERGAAAGIPLNELKQFASLSAKAADSFEMSATDVGNAAAGFKVSLGIPIKGMQRYFDLINGLADSGIADESDLVNFLDRAGASLKQFGLSAEQAAAYGATMSNLKMAPDIGANALSTLTGKLLSPGSPKAQKALAAIVGNTVEFTKLLKKDGNAAVLQFLDSINKLDKFKATELLNGFIGEGFDDEVLRLAKGADELRRNLGYAANEAKWFGSLDTSYKLKLDDFWSQWQLVKNALEKLAIDGGTMGMPAFKAALDGALYLVAEVDKGLKKFKAEINIDALTKATDAVGDLGGAIGKVLALGGEGSALETFFGRVATSVNLVSDAVGLARDAAEAIGLVKEDDTAAERAARRQRAVDGYAEFTGESGPGPLIKHIHDNLGNETMTPEKRAALDKMQLPKEQQYDPGGTLSHREWLQQKRARDIERANARAEQLRQQVQEWAAPKLAALPRPAAQGPSPVAALAPAVAIPTPRPDIAGPVKAESDAAALAAEQAGARITEAFNVTATPKVDASSIDALIAKARTAKAVLTDLGATANSVSAAASGKVGRVTAGAQSSMNDTFSDIER
ncbi:hypothetical protein ASG43_08880 [Aureimonas sp. Leaf454]|uniref:phage tail tape measure protein n=1 Tax=Aureimonas sp. Leaf454 TaxID=1736381 RepID=UPI0006FD809E|nr:phage tail tape measure protein [Aureimonas sp. Leaf454]KQT48937.1 hypothetical protein ASG43_08880 [Aureimonas sp. Leaf454]